MESPPFLTTSRTCAGEFVLPTQILIPLLERRHIEWEAVTVGDLLSFDKIPTGEAQGAGAYIYPE